MMENEAMGIRCWWKGETAKILNYTLGVLFPETERQCLVIDSPYKGLEYINNDEYVIRLSRKGTLRTKIFVSVPPRARFLSLLYSHVAQEYIPTGVPWANGSALRSSPPPQATKYKKVSWRCGRPVWLQ